MSFRRLFLLFILELIIASLVAFVQTGPGYMDADYYYAGGMQLAKGTGFREPFLWNYLDDPAGLPHPSHAYWMPLASLLAAMSMRLAGGLKFSEARLAFIFFASLIPPATALFSYQLSHNQRDAMLSGLLAVFSGFYLPYLATTDTFGLNMLLGILFMMCGYQLFSRDDGNLRAKRFGSLASALLGVTASLMYLARADGILWLFLALAIVWWAERTKSLPFVENCKDTLPAGRGIRCLGPAFVGTATCLLGFLIVAGPWMVRNRITFGTVLAPGGSRALWLTSYNELFAYPASQLNLAHWWQSGLRAIVEGRLQALWQNFQTTVVVQGEIFLFPLVLIGLWKMRKDHRVQIGLAGWVMIGTAMTILFPYAGIRGGFLHSGAALQPLFWAAAPAGLDGFVNLGVRFRGWQTRRARSFFFGSLVLLALSLSAVLVYWRVIGQDLSRPGWGSAEEKYTLLGVELAHLGASPEDVAMVNNPPGFFIATNRSAIVIPDGDLQTLLAAARRYQARYLLLEIDQVQGSSSLYNQPGNVPGLRYLTSYEQTRIYQILDGD